MRGNNKVLAASPVPRIGRDNSQEDGTSKLASPLHFASFLFYMSVRSGSFVKIA